MFKLSAVLADIECTCCEEEYYQTLPFEFSQQPKLSFLKKYGKVKYEPVEETRALSLLQTIQHEPDVSLEIIQMKSATRALLLNCLFEEEVEVLSKLISSTHYLSGHENLALVVLIKEELAYLVPEDTPEIWKVRSEAASSKPLNEWISSELPRFEKLYLPSLDDKAKTYDISWERFFKVRPFRSAVPEGPAIVTFFCHPSQFWHSNKWEKLLFQLSVKWHIQPFLKPYFEKRQLRKFWKLADKLGRLRPTEFFVIGFGKARASSLFQDERVEEEKTGIYQNWIQLLAKTSITIGVFGNKLPAKILSSHCLELYAEEAEKPLPKTSDLGGNYTVKEVYDNVEKILREGACR